MKWFQDNKVWIFGFLSAIILPVNDLIQSGNVSVKSAVFSAITAGLSWAAHNLRGQWASIAGAVGTTVAMLLAKLETGEPISWAALIGALIVQLLAIFAPPAKSVGYERTRTVEMAKREGEDIVPSSASKP